MAALLRVLFFRNWNFYKLLHLKQIYTLASHCLGDHTQTNQGMNSEN